MLFAESVAGDMALYAAAGGALAAVVGAWYTGRGKARADALLEYKALYDASRSEVHMVRDETNQALLRLQAQAAQDRQSWQERSDATQKTHDAQMATLTNEVFNLHREHSSCIKENGELRGRFDLLQYRFDAISPPSTPATSSQAAEATRAMPG